MIFRNHANNAQETLFLLAQLKTVLLLNTLDEQSLKEQHLFETEMVCSIIHVFIFTFDQLNAF